MLNKQFWSNTVIGQHNQYHYVNLQMDPLDNPLTTPPIQTGWEISIELYPNWLFRCIDEPDRRFSMCLVPTRSRTRSHGPELLATVAPSEVRSTATSSLSMRPDCQRNEIEHGRSQRPSISVVKVSMSELWERSQIYHYQLAPSEARLSAIWDWACQSSETKHVGALNVSMSELWGQAYQLWKWAYQSCGSEARSKAFRHIRANSDSLLLTKPDPLLPAKPDPPLPASDQRSEIQCFMPARNESWFSATSEATSTPASMLPARPDLLLPVKPVLPLPAMLNPPLAGCLQWSQILREVRVSMSERWDQA